MAATARQRRAVDPGTDARPDGCGRDYIAQTQRNIPTWVYVGDRNAPATGPPPPPRRLEGVVDSRYERDLAVHPTPEDLPTIHRSYDLNLNVLPTRPYRRLLGGRPPRRRGNFAGRGESTARVHVEREQGSTPASSGRMRATASPSSARGSGTAATGRRGGERTEIHPFRALWVERNGGAPSPASARGESEGDLFLSSDKTYAGVVADCAHRAKGVVLAFRACLAVEPEQWQDVSGTYRFRLRVPPRPRPALALRVRVLDAGSSAGAPRARARVRGNGVDVRLVVPPRPGKRVVVAQRVLAGWSGAAAPVHVRVRFERLLVRRAMDPGCPGGRPTCGSKQTTHGEQISAPPGEWNVYVDAAGVWKTWGRGLLRARDGQVFRGGPTFDLRLARGRPWRVFVFTRECDFGSARQRRRRRRTRWRRARPRRSSARSTATMSPGSRWCASPRRPRRSARTACDRGARDRRVRPSTGWAATKSRSGWSGLGYNNAVAQDDRQDIISQLADRGQEALGKIGDLNLPGGQKLLQSANQLKERADELQRRLRGLDALERRVDALEKKVDQLSKAEVVADAEDDDASHLGPQGRQAEADGLRRERVAAAPAARPRS